VRFAFTSEQYALRDAVRDVLKKECTPAVVRAAWASDGAHVMPLWRTLARVGLAGLTVAADHGGLGLGDLDLVLLLEECGYAAVPAPVVETTAVAAPLLAAVFGSEARTSEWLRGIAAGEAIVAVGLAGAPFVRDADVASLLLLERDGALHAVPRASVTLEMQPAVDGSRRLFRVDGPASAVHCVARGRLAERAASLAFDRGALGASAELVGLARRMIDMTVDYVSVRKQFGAPIGSFQAVKHHLADALVKVEFARPVVYRAAYSVDRGNAEREVHVSMAKAMASDAAAFAARTALQCHGAIGYTFEHDLHLFMKRTWALAASWGDAAFHRARVAAVVLGAEGEAPPDTARDLSPDTPRKLGEST
jgi:alkylation response protein AidB-like acyl-CoA dehydrogenase